VSKYSKKILGNQFIVPFGRLRLKRVRPRDDSPVLIGRESQRAFFVDALTGIGERGAFLVTGRRGVGKSTFVENCLDDYRQNVFRRFLGSGVGRSFLDLLFLALFTLAVLGVLLAAGELLSFLVPSVQDSPLLLLPLVICIGLAIFPFVMGVRAIRTALGIYFGRWVGFMTTVGVFVFVLTILFLPPFGLPGEALSTVIAGLGFLFFSSSILYFARAPIPLGPFEPVPGNTKGEFIWKFIGPRFLFLNGARAANLRIGWRNFFLAGLLCVIGMIGSHFLGNWMLDTPEGVKFHVLIGGTGISLILGTIIGNAAAIRWITLVKTNKLPGDMLLGRAVLSKTLWVIALIFGVFLGLVSASEGYTPETFWLFLGCFVFSMMSVSVVRSALYLRFEDFSKFRNASRDGVRRSLQFAAWLIRSARILLVGPAFIASSLRSSDFWQSLQKKRSKDGALPRDNARSFVDPPPMFLAPPVEAMLVLKGFAYILVSIQLLFPLFPHALDEPQILTDGTVLDEGSAVQIHQSENSGSTNQMFCFAEPPWFLPNPLQELLSCDGNMGDRPPEAYAMFQAENLATGWFVAAFLLIIALFLVEYEWINRPFVNQRQARALDRAPRRPHQIHHHMDPIWFEVSAKRQWQRQWEAQENLKPEERTIKGFETYYGSDMGIDPGLFRRRNDLQRRGVRRFRMMEQQTFTYALTQLWLPVLEVNVNLGFDSLDHRGVTHAMLDGLRRAYRRKFVSLRSSPYAVLRALGITFVIMIATVRLGEAWFDVPVGNQQQSDASDTAYERYWRSARTDAVTGSNGPDASRFTYLCGYLRNVRIDGGQTPLVTDILCQAPTLVAGPTLELLYAEVVPFSIAEGDEQGRNQLAFWFTHRNQAPPFAGEEWGESLSVRGYHLLLAVLLFTLLERIGRRMPLLPYRKNLARIEALLDDLTLSRADSRNARAGIGVGNLFELSRGVETSREALDPRSVELKLLSLLNDLRGKPGFQDRGRWTNVTMPMPDIHFIFDELDKLSGIVSPELAATDAVEQDREALDSERQRAYRLRSLLSDMKRVISSAPARFIFVGGRTLHDEWVRDQNRLGSTQPLLTSIFDHEIYLPSLLVDFSRARYANTIVDADTQPDRMLDLRIKEFLVSSYHSARVFQDALKESRFVPFIGLQTMSTSAQKFSESSVRKREDFSELTLIDARRRQKLTLADDDAYLKLLAVWQEEFFNIFVGFLAYRSAGSPKKLNELLAELVRPSGALLHPEIEGDIMVPSSQDALVIDEKELFRMQLINSLFRHIETSFGNDLLQRDDKITINTIFMFDFLMKMHNRAFSWSSIERLDELAHIHRAPDLRRLFDSVISNSAERYFHRVLNGLFSFRFRSELAIEIRYLSRISQTEMAALNFTLDESQELKATFTRMLEKSGDANPDLMTALGELYEFDQAYDIARQHYERAIVAIDSEFVRLNGEQLGPDNNLQAAMNDALAGNGVVEGLTVQDLVTSERPGPPEDPFLHAMLGQSQSGKDAIRINLPWGIRRLRLMLQVGLTYEQQADEERAQAQYQSAQLFASHLLRTALATEQGDPAPLSHVLKHLPLIFQPVFASAWVAEKLENGVDTSLSIVEHEIRFLRSHLPFVNIQGATDTPELAEVTEKPRDARSNHLLVMAEIHNKAGDLNFFKGRAAYNIKSDNFPQSIPKNKERDGTGTEGYLFRGHYHYAMALHEVRRFVFYRRHAGKTRLSLAFETGQEGSWYPLDAKNLPTFVYQTAASSMVDLAEVTLARSSILEAWQELDAAEAATAHWLKQYPEPKQREENPKAPEAYLVGEIFSGAAFSIKDRLTAIGEVKKAADEKFGAGDPKAERATAQAVHSYGEGLFGLMRHELDGWFQMSDQDTRDEPQTAAARIVQDYLGNWRKVGPKKDNATNILKFGEVSFNHERILVSLMLSLYGGRAVNRSNYPDAASFETQITAEHVVRLLRSIRGTLAVAQSDRVTPPPENKRPNCAELFRISPAQLDLISTLIEIGLYALSRLTELKNLAYPEDAKTDYPDVRYRTTDTSQVVAAALATALRNLISNISALVIKAPEPDHTSRDAYLDHWRYAMEALERRTKDLLSPELLAHVGAYDHHFEDQSDVFKADPILAWRHHRKHSRALMIYLVTHHRYPALTNLTVLKALIDDVSVVDGLGLSDASDERATRIAEGKQWFRELLDAEKLLDAPMHYPPSHIAETASLLALSDTDDDRLAEGVSRRFRWRAEQSFTLGRQYYHNISRLIYLFDDFNDRRRHSIHAGQMGMADMLALYRLVFDNRKSSDRE